MNSEEIKRRQDQIPGLYATEKVDFDYKLVYKRFRHAGSMSNWLMAEYSNEEKIFFGWACLHGDLEMAEWGYVYEPELDSIGADLDEYWIPLYFPEARNLVLGYMKPAGTKEHFDYWRHENELWLRNFHVRTRPRLDFGLFVELTYKDEHGLG